MGASLDADTRKMEAFRWGDRDELRLPVSRAVVAAATFPAPLAEPPALPLP
jgi:hypothetical protein